MSVMFENMIGTATGEFNGKVITLSNIINGPASYTTVLPISPWSYRKKSPTKTRYKYTRGIEQSTIGIYDDWGNKYIIIIDNNDPVLLVVLNYYKKEHIPEII